MAEDYEDINLYLLAGSKLSEGKSKRSFNKRYGHFKETDTNAIIFPVHDGKTIDFRFKDIEIKPWKEFRDKRIGRLLPPHIYICRIQQRYALYMQRTGLPRVPKEAIM